MGASILLGTAVAALLDPVAGAILLAATAGVIAVSILGARIGRSAAGRGATIRAELADQVVETVRSAPELVAFGRQDLITARLEDARRRARTAALRQALGRGIARALATWAAGAGLIGVVLAGLAAHRAGQLSGIMLTVLVLVSVAALDQGSLLPAALTGRATGTRPRAASPSWPGSNCRSASRSPTRAHQSEGAALCSTTSRCWLREQGEPPRARPTPSRRPPSRPPPSFTMSRSPWRRDAASR